MSDATWPNRDRIRQVVRAVYLTGLLFGMTAFSISCGEMTAQGREPEGWQFGRARRDITPTQPMWMSGYASRDRPAEETLTRLWAKVLVLEDAYDERALLVTLDLIGIDRELMQSLQRRIAAAHDLAPKQIAINTSHTHTGPVVGRNLGPMGYLLADEVHRQRIVAYAESLEEKILDAIDEAMNDLQPGMLHFGQGRTDFAVNRRNNRPESDVPRKRTRSELQGPVDHDVPVLTVRDAEQSLRAVVFGYACHATVLSSFQWSGDYPGFAQLALEQSHDDCQAMFWAGCGGDQNPLPRRTVDLARHYGRQLATAVDRIILTSQMAPVDAQLRCTYRELDLPFDELPDRAQLESDAQDRNRHVAARARMLLDRIDDGRDLSATYPYPIQVWRLGNQIDWVFLGGEVVVDYALRIKSLGPRSQTWVAGYSNDVMAYIPSRRVWSEGGYEGGGAMVYYGLPARWSPRVEELIIAEVVRQWE